MKLSNIILSAVLLTSFSFADQLDDFEQTTASKFVRLTEVQKQGYINELSGVNPIKWFFWMTNSGRVFIADTRSGENADSTTIWEHSLTNFTWTPVSGGSAEKIFDTISLSSDGRSITLGAATSSNTQSTVAATPNIRTISKYVVQMGNVYDDVGTGAGSAVSGVNSATTSSSAFARKATRADIGQFKFNGSGTWAGKVGQTIMGVDPDVTMEFIRTSTGALIVEDITQVSNYVDITTGQPGPIADLASGFQMDLKKVNIKIGVNMGTTPLSVSGSSVVLQPLTATIPMTTGAMPELVTFETTGVLTTPDGTTLNMENVKINMNPSTPTKMNGTYDFSKVHEGETYTGTATFDQTGCTGADVYQAGQKVGVVKIINGEFRLQGPNGEFDEVIAL